MGYKLQELIKEEECINKITRYQSIRNSEIGKVRILTRLESETILYSDQKKMPKPTARYTQEHLSLFMQDQVQLVSEVVQEMQV